MLVLMVMAYITVGFIAGMHDVAINLPKLFGYESLPLERKAKLTLFVFLCNLLVWPYRFLCDVVQYIRHKRCV